MNELEKIKRIADYKARINQLVEEKKAGARARVEKDIDKAMGMLSEPRPL